MLQKMEISGVHYEVDPRLRAYITKKFGKLERYVPRRDRATAQLEIRLREPKVERHRQAQCDIVFRMPPRETIRLAETAPSMSAAVNLVADKLKQRIEQCKDEYHNGKQRRHLFARLKSKLTRRPAGLEE